MNENIFIPKLETAINGITHPRFYESERGYQGALVSELNKILPDLELNGAIVEQEYQKRIEPHGIRIRPDIIIHVPFDSNNNSRSEGNFIAIELKLGSDLTERQAAADYQSLALMCEHLSYPLAIFIVINGSETYFEKYSGPHKDKMKAYIINLIDGAVVFKNIEYT